MNHQESKKTLPVRHLWAFPAGQKDFNPDALLGSAHQWGKLWKVWDFIPLPDGRRQWRRIMVNCEAKARRRLEKSFPDANIWATPQDTFRDLNRELIARFNRCKKKNTV